MCNVNKQEMFGNIIGYDNVKKTLSRTLDVLQNNEKYKRLGVNIPHGILIHGNAGIGKTTFAVKFIEYTNRKSYIIRKSKSNGEFINSISKTFDEAVKNSPSIILLDDLDKFSDDDYRSEEYATVQSLIDNVKDKDVFIIATANETNAFPDSLLRAGRFDYIIELTSPTRQDAEKIIKYYLSEKQVSSDVDPTKIVNMLDGRACAELEKVINEAGILAGYQNKVIIEMEDIVKACLSVIYKTSFDENTYQSKYLLNTAYHEAGHALIAEYLEPNSISFISVATGNNTDIKGVTVYYRNEDYWRDFTFMENRLKCLLASKAATEIVYGKCDTAVNQDLNRAYDIATRFIDDFAIYGFDTHEYNGRLVSESLKHKVEIRIENMISHYYNEVKAILINNRGLLDSIATELAKKGILFSEDIQRLKANC